MDFLNIGGGELLLIVLFALILFGPEDIIKIMRSVGKYTRTARQMWSQFTSTVQDEYLASQELEEALAETKATVAEAQQAIEDAKTSVEETTAAVQKDVAEAQRSLKTQAAESAAALRKAGTERKRSARERLPKPVPATKPWLTAPVPPSPQTVLVDVRRDPALSPSATTVTDLSAAKPPAPTPAAAHAALVTAEAPETAAPAPTPKPWQDAPHPPSPETVVVDVRRDPALSPPVRRLSTPEAAPVSGEPEPTEEPASAEQEAAQAATAPAPRPMSDGAAPPLPQSVPVSPLPDPAFRPHVPEATTSRPSEAAVAEAPVDVDSARAAETTEAATVSGTRTDAPTMAESEVA
jgi:Tat protein translocase TatB subunit